jgi:hypothetical protein
MREYTAKVRWVPTPQLNPIFDGVARQDSTGPAWRKRPSHGPRGTTHDPGGSPFAEASARQAIHGIGEFNKVNVFCGK